MNRRHIAALLAMGALAGCGADTMSAAATAGSIKKQELQQGQQTLEQSKEKIDQALQVSRERAIAGQ
jgi:hypothetical protein